MDREELLLEKVEDSYVELYVRIAGNIQTAQYSTLFL